jgi:hypothetical protein
MHTFRHHAQYCVATSLQWVALALHWAMGRVPSKKLVTLVADSGDSRTRAALTSRATGAGTCRSTCTNGAASTSCGFAADGAASLTSGCGSRITSPAFQTRVATGQSNQAGRQKSCRSGHLHEALHALSDILFPHDPEKMVPLFGCTGCIKKLPGGFRASGKPHSVDAAWNAPVKAGPSLVHWCLIQWATVVRLGSRLGSRLQCYIMVQIETAWNTRPLRFQIFTNDFAR